VDIGQVWGGIVSTVSKGIRLSFEHGKGALPDITLREEDPEESVKAAVSDAARAATATAYNTGLVLTLQPGDHIM
jgi:hypothetical protein